MRELIAIPALISWVAICATYLRFHSAVTIHNKRNDIPQKARSPLQPYLAWYGLVMSSLCGCLLSFNLLLTLVIFWGFAAFTRNNAVWSIVNNDWGFEVVPWVMTGVVLALFLGWHLHDYYKRGQLSLGFIPLDKVNLNGIVHEESEDKPPRNWLIRSCLWILDMI